MTHFLDIERVHKCFFNHEIDILAQNVFIGLSNIFSKMFFVTTAYT